ncbi:MAG: flagellar export protein FliJ [Thermotogaceae bacterium]|nr:flagellar export protein FliJ [Thermotogaceae bacterium]
MIIKKRRIIYVDSPRIRSVETEEERKEKEIEVDVEKILKEAREQAREIVEKAEKEAEEILKKAREQEEELLEKAKNNAERLEREYIEKLEKIDKIVKNFEENLNREIDKVVQLILPTLKVLFRKILEKAIDEEIVERKIRSVLGKIASMKKVTIRVNPDDVSRISDDLKEYFERNGIEMKLDPNVEKGGIVVETELGVIDKTFGFQWKLVEDIIEEVIGSE